MPKTDLTVKVDITGVSDGYHTFGELYEHRHALFLALMRSAPALAWISTRHADGTSYEGWFIAGMHLGGGEVSYHLPARLWMDACATGATVLEQAPEWDGHTADDVVMRLRKWAKRPL